MNTIFTSTLKTLALSLVLAAIVHPAQAAQPVVLHTYVTAAGTGDDGNPCSRISPCATFQGALSKVGSGGVITALDAGDYGPVNITQAVTIDGTGTQVGIMINSGNAITIGAGAGNTVILRHLNLSGLAGDE